MTMNSIFSIYKPYIEHAQIVNKVNDKIGYFIKTYAVNKLTKYKDKISNDVERNQMEVLIKEYNSEKKKNAGHVVTYEEYNDFLEVLFRGVDEEERTEDEISYITCAAFRLIVDLIDVITEWKTIPEEWVKISI